MNEIALSAEAATPGTAEPAAAKRPADPRLADPRFAIPPHRGEPYYTVLRRLHEVLAPRTYLEVGIREGKSLALATCASIGVDPSFVIGADATGNKPALHLFRMGSDAFFERHDPKALLGGPVDMAFLDGMHLFEFLLRDFLNTEPHCRPNSVVVLHDCLPTDVGQTRRTQARPTPADGPTRNPILWTGDVWKVVAILRKYRPELRLLTLDAPPTGLVAITGLDPRSTLLKGRYFDIVREFREVSLAEIGLADYVAQQDVQPTRSLLTMQDIARHFWL